MMRFQKTISMLLCALVALIGLSYPATAQQLQKEQIRVDTVDTLIQNGNVVEFESAIADESNKAQSKGKPFAGVSAVQQQDLNSEVYYAVKNGPPNSTVAPEVIRINIQPDGSWSQATVLTGESKQTFVSLGVRPDAINGGLIAVTTTDGEVLFASMATGDSYITYGGLEPGILYGLIFTETEIGIGNPITRQIEYIELDRDLRYARYLRTEQPETTVVPGDCSTVMGLLGANAWDVVKRSQSGSTTNYLVSCSGSVYAPVTAPSLRQMAYDHNTGAATTTVIKTGVAGTEWYGISFDGTNVYLNTRAGGITKIVVSTAVMTTLVATGVSYSNFAADNVVRIESGVPQIYSLDEYAYLRKVNGNTGATTTLGVLADDVHGRAIVLDGNTGLAFTAIGYIGGVNSVAVYKCSFAGTGYSTYAKHSVALPQGSFYNWFGVARTDNNDFAVIDNASGRVIRVNSPAGPWADICSHTGGQNMSIILDNRNTGTSHDDLYIAADFAQGGGSLNLLDRP